MIPCPRPTPAAQLHSVSWRYRAPWVNRSPRDWNWANGPDQASVPPSTSSAAEIPAPEMSCERDEKLARLEAILFIASESLSSRKLSQLANLADATEARTLIRQLNAMYDQSGRAFRVEEVAEGYQLMTRPQFGTWLRRLQHVPGELRLSAPTLETLAVVAYRQPAARADIDAIRGVNCGEILRQLLERDLIRISGRSDDLGRPYLYSTTKRFLQLFGLRNLEDLPKANLFHGAATVDARLSDTNDIQGALEPGEKKQQEDSDVSVTSAMMLIGDDEVARRARLARKGKRLAGPQSGKGPNLAKDEDLDEDELEDEELEDDDEDDFDDDEEDDFEDDDEEDDLDDEDELFEDEEEDDLEEDDELEEEEEEDEILEEEWEEVDDEEDDDWDDEDDDEDEEEDDDEDWE